MRPALLAVVLVLALNVGCGYVGPVVPPSPMLPAAVSDLSVVERGDKLYIAFSTPATTTDAISIKQFSDIELRIGPDVTPFDFERWQATGRQYEILLPERGDSDAPTPVAVSKTIPVSEWQGRRIAVAVRTALKGEKHFSQWSNRISLNVVSPLQPLQVNAEPTSQGYRLTWNAERPGLHYQVLRSSLSDKTAIPIGVAEKPEYIDGTSQWDTPYQYAVVAQLDGNVESLPSAAVLVNEPDKFPPTVPSAVTALAGPDSIEITWTRSPEPDLKGYLVYRSVNNSPLAVVGELTALPTFSDTKAEHGHTYKYAISSIDNNNNESDKSQPVEVTF